MSTADCFHVGEYLADELNARGMTADELAERMGGDFAVNRLSIDMLLLLKDEGLLMGDDLAADLERALGIDAKTWIDLDAEWRRCMKLRSN